MNPIEFEIPGYELREYHLKKEILIQLVEVAEKLSKNFPQVRVDLYYAMNKIIFGELTFYGASGYIDLKKFDYILGEKFNINEGMM